MKIASPQIKTSLSRSPASPQKESTPEIEASGNDSLVDKVAEFSGETFRTLGGTAAVALKSPGILTSSMLKSAGMEEQKAERFGSVASLLTFGTAFPLAVMGTGVVGTVAVKGLGVGEQLESESSEESGALSTFKANYSEGVNEAYSDGSFLADGVMDGLQTVSSKVGEKVSGVSSTVADKAEDAWEFARGLIS